MLGHQKLQANLLLDDELNIFFLRFSWNVCRFTLIKPIIMGVYGFDFSMTLSEAKVWCQVDNHCSPYIYKEVSVTICKDSEITVLKCK